MEAGGSQQGSAVAAHNEAVQERDALQERRKPAVGVLDRSPAVVPLLRQRQEVRLLRIGSLLARDDMALHSRNIEWPMAACVAALVRLHGRHVCASRAQSTVHVMLRGAPVTGAIRARCVSTGRTMMLATVAIPAACSVVLDTA
jgi:hypothetical protein